MADQQCSGFQPAILVLPSLSSIPNPCTSKVQQSNSACPSEKITNWLKGVAESVHIPTCRVHRVELWLPSASGRGSNEQPNSLTYDVFLEKSTVAGIGVPVCGEAVKIN